MGIPKTSKTISQPKDGDPLFSTVPEMLLYMVVKAIAKDKTLACACKQPQYKKKACPKCSCKFAYKTSRPMLETHGERSRKYAKARSDCVE